MLRQVSLYLPMPRSSTCCRLVIPSALSISNSTGRPWQSHPNRRATWRPRIDWWRVTTSLMVPARMWP
uniref:Uncharacterized protein n=1 Tax=Arundo donax TaxID=35708 RepID=A0A0A9DFF4_ARUDO